MLEIDRSYVAVALILAIVGMLLGLYMGATADNRLVTLHVAIVLPGFVTLAIYGMPYRLWPAMKKARLAPSAILGDRHRHRRNFRRHLLLHYQRPRPDRCRRLNRFYHRRGADGVAVLDEQPRRLEHLVRQFHHSHGASAAM